MNIQTLQEIFTDSVLDGIFPAERTDRFFEALFGDPSEGAYDIRLRYRGYDSGSSTLRFSLDLHERPNRCLVCSLTYGLPQVFSRHPVIDVKGVVREIGERLRGQAVCTEWRLGATVQQEKSRHSIPLIVSVRNA